MTNIVASIVVSIVTNTVEVWPQKLVQDPSPIGPNGEHYALFVGHHEADKSKGIKTNVTTCKEITTLRFDWNGARVITSEKVLWETNVALKLEWK